MNGSLIGQLEIPFTASEATRFVDLALACVHREYPNKIAHVMDGDEDARPPRELTPVFFGCYDWHSAVHGHWLLARALAIWPEAEFAEKARAALRQSFTQEKVAGELAYFHRSGREPFERPYGLAWLLQLCAELRESKEEALRAHALTLAPLEALAVARFLSWLPKLSHPIRTGEHSQTAFAFGLALDWAKTAGHKELETLLIDRGRAFYLKDREAPLAYEPSGQDFLSPVLAEADFVRRILPATEFAAWLMGFLPDLREDSGAAWLSPAVVTDKTDGKLAHLDGLNLSRAWMLLGIASALPAADPRRGPLLLSARAHRNSGLASLSAPDYAGGHWLGSFACYLVTNRGLKPRD